jgi:endonuclease III
LEILNATYPDHPMGLLAEGNPYRVLVACIMSLRSKDDLIIPLARKLFETVDSPEALAALSEAEIERHIYPAGFYKTKARQLKVIAQRLVDEFNSQVPSDIETLLSFKGIGRKTANLVRGLGHGLPAVCVDVHVHRISERLGYLNTTGPDETEFAIRDSLPEPYWPIINRVMVRHGQDCCKAIKPKCSMCPVATHCASFSD